MQNIVILYGLDLRDDVYVHARESLIFAEYSMWPAYPRIGEVLPSKTVPIPRDNIRMLLSLLLLQCTLAFVTSSSSYVWPVVRHLVGS